MWYDTLCGLGANTYRKEVSGYLRSEKRKEWKFISDDSAEISDLCMKLQQELSTPVKCDAPPTAIIKIAEEVKLLAGEEVLYAGIDQVIIEPRHMTECTESNTTINSINTTENPLRHITECTESNKQNSVIINSEINARDNTQSVISNKGFILLYQIGVKKRTCRLCRVSLGVYRRVRDILIPSDISILCSKCYQDIHWHHGGRRYEHFTYEMKED
ncbi:hypothetical protein NEIG_02160 [Nematocida sp. ERTm5]|nr:hypothetical protein NEIG_02160 [Nematocida sp. ERTm5]